MRNKPAPYPTIENDVFESLQNAQTSFNSTPSICKTLRIFAIEYSSITQLINISYRTQLDNFASINNYETHASESIFLPNFNCPTCLDVFNGVKDDFYLASHRIRSVYQDAQVKLFVMRDSIKPSCRINMPIRFH